MLAEQAGPQEALGADAAGVGFGSHVDLLVRSQAGGGGKGLPTHRAAVQLLCRVDLEVLFESGRPRVALPADGAAVKPLHATGTSICRTERKEMSTEGGSGSAGLRTGSGSSVDVRAGAPFSSWFQL